MVVRNSTNSDKYKEILDRTLPNIDIIKYATVQYDGKQFMIKLPKEITEFYKLKKGDTIKLAVRIDTQGNDHKTEFEVIHESPKRK